MSELCKIRKTIVEIIHDANVSHIGSAMSVADILYVLYFKIANISKENINDNNRDIVILSKGHASAALYSVLYHKGLISKELLEGYSKDFGTLPCHIDKEKSPFFEISSGSLGHGPSVGAGMALAKKMDKNNGRVFVICGDGECEEGSVWEAIMFATTHKLDNLVLIIDCNKLQGFGTTNDIINQNNLAQRLESFGLEVISIDGNNTDEIEKALKHKRKNPLAIVANTIKGKGVSFMENRLEWHYKSPNDEQLKTALQEIEEKYQ